MKSLNFTRNIFSILVLVSFSLTTSGRICAQILSFEFAGLTGSEVSSNSNFIATGLNSSTIIRGSGLTPTNNADRFNSNNWAITSISNAISGNNYVEFTISPNVGKQFSISTLIVQWQRSSTGNTQIVLRSSVDGFSTNIDGVKNITDNTSTQTITWNVNQSNSSQGVTYRLYSYAEASTGTGGPGDGTGNDIVVSGTVSDIVYSWTGSTSSDPTVAANWSPAAVPASTASVVIPTGLTNYPSFTNNSTPSFASITIDAGASLTLQSGSELTVSGTLTNNGTLTLENNATIVQGASSTYSGSGIVQVKQTITGGNNGNSPNGRFWYLGSPVSGGLSSILDAAGANIVKYWDEQSAAWIEITDNTSALTVGRGHYLRSNTPGNHDLTFTGGSLNNGAYTFNVTANGSSFNGFNLVSNPYASYLKWDDVTKTNVGSTIWYRTSNGANNMVFDTYNSNGNVGTSNNGNGTVSQFIPPMQAFWVKVEGSTTGSIAMDNLDRSHHISGMQGMHSMDSKLMFANLSLEKDSLRDQAIVYCSYETTDAQDVFDSEKMIQAGSPQLYSKIGDKKMVINAKNFMQRNEATPLYMNIHNAGTHTIKLGEFNSTFGSIWLEDKTTQQFQNLLINDTYTFESQVGQDIARFVLHFGYPNQIYGSTEATDQPNNNPDEVINWADVSVGTSGSKVIELTANLNEAEALQTKTMAIFDMTGRQVLTQSFESGNTQVYIPNANGVYLVQVQIGNTQKVFKVLIQE
jgi:hypothetical protein